MEKNANVEVYRLRTNWESEIAPVIIMGSRNREKGDVSEYLTNINGAYVYAQGTPPEEHEAGKVKFSPNMAMPSARDKKLWYIDFEVASGAYLDYISKNPEVDPKTPLNYNNDKEIVKFLKTHNQVIFVNKEGKQNPNINPSMVIYTLENITSASTASANYEIKANEAAFLIGEWSTKNTQRLIDFCYLWGLKGIEKHTAQSLYLTIVKEVKANVGKYIQVEKWLDDEIRVLVSKALLTDKKDSKEAVVYKNGTYFIFNGETLGESQEDAVNYFTTHPQEYKILKNLLNVVEKIEVELPNQTAVVVAPNEVFSNSAEKLELDIEKDKQKIEYKLSQLKDNKNIIIEKVKNRYIPIDGVEYTKSSVLAEFALNEIVVKHGLQDFYWTRAKELGITIN
jgi:hypothetical protein